MTLTTVLPTHSDVVVSSHMPDLLPIVPGLFQFLTDINVKRALPYDVGWYCSVLPLSLFHCRRFKKPLCLSPHINVVTVIYTSHVAFASLCSADLRYI